MNAHPFPELIKEDRMPKELGARFDARLGRGAERIVRKIDRRTALRSGILGGAATIGAIVLGQNPASAARPNSVRCPQECGPSPLCSSGCPQGVGQAGCPPNHTLCKKPSVCGNKACDYYDGSWVHCEGYGPCGMGYTLCQDCKPNGNCHICICISGVACSGCCTPSDVIAEQRRIQAALAVA